MDVDIIWSAARLIAWGLRPQARPAQEPEYSKLVELYFENGQFRNAVRLAADGLGLTPVEVSAHGIILLPHEDSVFALKPADFRPGGAKGEERLLDGLIQIAIAATVFPRSRDLDEDRDLARPPITVEEVDATLRSVCSQLAQQAQAAPDPKADDSTEGLLELWRIYASRLPVVETRDGRVSPRSTYSQIKYALEWLRQNGFFTALTYRGEPAWQPSRRYQAAVQDLSATRIYGYVEELLSNSAKNEGIS